MIDWRTLEGRARDEVACHLHKADCRVIALLSCNQIQKEVAKRPNKIRACSAPQYSPSVAGFRCKWPVGVEKSLPQLLRVGCGAEGGDLKPVIARLHSLHCKCEGL